MASEVRRSLACRQDLDDLFEHLQEACQSLGDPETEAFARAVARIEAIEDLMDQLGAAPHQDTPWPEIMDGLRWTTKDRAIFYFKVDDENRTVDVLAVLFGGQDHKAHVLSRILHRGRARP